MTATVELVPSARRLIRSLRDMGYEFPSAVADLVDNSLAAKASDVFISVDFDGDDSVVGITDNGHGMSPEELREAMRYGSEREYDASDLGKFGLGLKTASMSQCRRLTVASRWNPNRADITAYCWDLDHIERMNRWEILPVRSTDLNATIIEPLLHRPGTAVQWQRLDRILGYKHPYGESARKRLLMMCRDLEEHLSMVFHRFMSGEARRSRKFKLTLNGNRLTAWDPFCRDEEMTQRFEPTRLAVATENLKGEVHVSPYILPQQDDFSSPEAFRSASGPSGWNQQQGLYIHRADRLIQSGGWSRLRKPDEHTKLARIALDFMPALDESFKINVAKMRVQLPQSIKEELGKITTPIVKKARQVYGHKARTVVAVSMVRESVVPNVGSPEATHTQHDKPSQGDLTQKMMTLDEFGEKVRGAATKTEWMVVKKVLDRMKKTLRSETT